LADNRVLSISMGMPISRKLSATRFCASLVCTLVLMTASSLVLADAPAEIFRMFPTDLGGFHQTRVPQQTLSPNQSIVVGGDYPSYALPSAGADAEYTSSSGEKIRVQALRFENDSAAYSWFTERLKRSRDEGPGNVSPAEGLCTASAFSSPLSLACFKGSSYITITSENGRNADQLKTLARVFAQTLDSGEGEVPVLVKHLPDYESAQRNAVYAVSPGPLLNTIPNQPILKDISFDGGTEAVTANYGQSQLVIVEFNTPQFSIENDQRMWTRIAELKSQNQPAPIAYRRIGNYSVFVFNAPDEKTANALIDQVRYEKVVQWLGEDPHMADRLQRYFTQTSAGVLVAVLKSSGLSLLLCLAAGGLFGTLLFRHRRAQQAALYSDAGGATRLNLDELTDTSKSHRLLESGKQPESDS
jgi:hypothetical protein